MNYDEEALVLMERIMQVLQQDYLPEVQRKARCQLLIIESLKKAADVEVDMLEVPDAIEGLTSFHRR